MSPGSGGAAATFPGNAASASNVTDANGDAIVPVLTANSSVGTFTVTATAAGVASKTFTETNLGTTGNDIICPIAGYNEQAGALSDYATDPEVQVI